MSQDPDVDHLSGDVPVHRLMSGDRPRRSAPTRCGAARWPGSQGYTGRGIGVAVIDSGIAVAPALREPDRRERRLHRRRGAGRDELRPRHARRGHHRRLAGLRLCRRGAGRAPRQPAGPEAPTGQGDTSDVIAAIDWAIEHRARYNLRIINLSLGHPVFESYRDDPLCQAVQRAVDAGMVVVAAAGNFGKTADGTAGRRRHRLAGQLAGGADGGRDQHARHGAAVGRRDGDLQLARADGDRRAAEAGAGGAGQPHRGGGGAGRLPDADVSGARGVGPGRRTPTSR